MAKRDGGFTCAMALTVHAIAVVLVLVTGTTRIGIFYTETLLLLAGSTVALLGGLVLANRSRSDRSAILLGVGLTLPVVLWMLWMRDRFGLDNTESWYNPVFQVYKPMPQIVLDLNQVPVRIVAPMLVIVAALFAVQAIKKWAGVVLATSKLSRRTMLTGLAILLYAGFLVQSQILGGDKDWNESIDGNSFSYWSPILPVLALIVLPATFYLPRLYLVAWASLICICVAGVAIEISFRTTLSVRGNITAILIIGFAMTATFLRSGAIRNVCDSAKQKWKPVRAALLVIPAAIIVLAGVMFVRSVDAGYWIGTGDYTLAAKIAKMRDLGVTVGYYQSGYLDIKLGDQAPNDVFAKLTQGFSLPVQTVAIQGMQKEIDVSPLTTASWMVGGATFRWRSQGYSFTSGEITENQLAALLSKSDVGIGKDVTVLSSEPGLNGMPALNSLHLNGTADSIINQLNNLRPNTLINNLSLSIQGDVEFQGDSRRAGELLNLVLQKAWGQNLMARFFCRVRTRNWQNPDGNCPWQSVDLTFVQSDWRLYLDLVAIKQTWPITLAIAQYPAPFPVDHPNHELLLRVAIASNGDVSGRSYVPGDYKWTSYSFENSFERMDCVLHRDESGNPVSLLALVPEWLQIPDDETCRRVESLLIGPEWVGLALADPVELPLVQSNWLTRFDGLKRLGLGLNTPDDYSFLQQMPELRELQVVGESAPERQADLANNLRFASKLERFMTGDIPDAGTIAQLANMANLKELVLIGIERDEVVEEKLDGFRKRLPRVEVRLQPESGFSAIRPADLIEHQKQMLQQLLDSRDDVSIDPVDENN